MGSYGIIHAFGNDSVVKECIRYMARRKLSRNEKIFYGVSLLIVFSMVFSMVASLFTMGL